MEPLEHTKEKRKENEERKKEENNVIYVYVLVWSRFLDIRAAFTLCTVVYVKCVSDFNSNTVTIAMLIECDKRTIHTFVWVTKENCYQERES